MQFKFISSKVQFVLLRLLSLMPTKFGEYLACHLRSSHRQRRQSAHAKTASTKKWVWVKNFKVKSCQYLFAVFLCVVVRLETEKSCGQRSKCIQWALGCTRQRKFNRKWRWKKNQEWKSLRRTCQACHPNLLSRPMLTGPCNGTYFGTHKALSLQFWD